MAGRDERHVVRQDDRQSGGPRGDEDGIDRLKAAERAAREGWTRDADGGYTAADGTRRDARGNAI